MKNLIRIFVLIAIIIPTATTTTIHAQPLYMYAQFDLPGKFGTYEAEIKKTYSGNIINAFAPRSDPRFIRKGNYTTITSSPKYREESEIDLRKKIYAKVDSSHYVLLCPEYATSNKIVICAFNKGFESVWQKPNGDYVYVIHRTTENELHYTGFLMLVYDKKNNSVHYGQQDEVREFYDILFPDVELYVVK